MATTAEIGSKFAAPRLSAVLAPFAAAGRFLVHLAETSPRMRAIDHLSRMSDDELAARGLTRDGELRRIMGLSCI